MKTRRNIPRFLLGSVLALVTLLVYSRVVTYPFTNFDDDDYVTNNPHVQLGITTAGVRWAFSSFEIANWHPLTWLSLQLDHELYGLQAGGYHATNLALHIANAVLLFLVFERMTGLVGRSLVVGALFALHPLHVESVAWVAERKDVLSTLFWMLALAAYVNYVGRPSLGRYLLVFVALGLGLMAKAMLVTLPFVLLLLDYWPLERWRGSGMPVGQASRLSSGPAGRRSHQGEVSLLLSILLEKVSL